MTGREAGSVGVDAVRETLWGRRGLGKVIHSALALGVAASLNSSQAPGRLWAAALQVFLVVGCWSQAAILTNDLADRREDAAAGKRRWIQRLPRGAGVLAAALAVGVGGLVLWVRGRGVALAAYGGAVALALLYSVTPVRLKGRGAAGPLTYAAAAALAYGVLPWAWVGANWAGLAAIAPAVLLDKWVNLQFHQVIDFEADRAAGTRTLAVIAGPERARRLLAAGAGLASLWLVGAGVFVVLSLPTWRAAAAGAWAAVALAVAAYAQAARWRAAAPSALLRDLPCAYLGLTFALFRALPLLLFARLALLEPSAWVAFGLVAGLVAVEGWHAFRYRYE